MKVNEKVILHILDFQTSFRKVPYPTYKIFKLFGGNNVSRM